MTCMTAHRDSISVFLVAIRASIPLLALSCFLTEGLLYAHSYILSAYKYLGRRIYHNRECFTKTRLMKSK